jgi:hypothetical protein
VGVLNACASKVALEEVHKDIVESGCMTDVSMGSWLTYMCNCSTNSLFSAYNRQSAQL